MQNQTELLSETKLIRNEKRKARRNYRRRFIKKGCCKQCGQPKHYICLEHNQYKKPAFFKRLPKLIRKYSRKIYFNFARRLGFVE